MILEYSTIKTQKMMSLCFLSAAISYWFIWKKKRKYAIIMFVVTTLLIILVAKYHIVDEINLQF
ncbi:DUF5993 family protein [Chryseobacterium paridis]|uniref:DUF5993 family protein n=1 Tax=Chryseobacterium paridis TaxID=2800328 RepID=UPI0037426FA1